MFKNPLKHIRNNMAMENNIAAMPQK